ncbi:MAG: hypothetical protein QNM02_10385 [Acidimicrobiia bacterium]|nr:hypothetical protein [Acidimicrobiia bacterium]
MTVGLLLTSLGLGLRHGIDWDHIAAIIDLTGTAENRRRGFVLSLLYAIGHAGVVFALGVVIILTGATIPAAIDGWMGRVVGFTLVALGVWIIVGLFRQGREFRLRSRWMLVIDGTFAGLRRVRGVRGGRRVAVQHRHDHEHADDRHEDRAAHDHAHLPVCAETLAELPAEMSVAAHKPGSELSDCDVSVSSRRHVHPHRHELHLPSDGRYGGGTATGIGMLHGVGIESPTQIALFVASTSAVGTTGGFALLGAWVLGLVLANSVLAVLAGFGLLGVERSFKVYAAVAVVVGTLSIAMGVLLLAGFDALPAIPT